MENSLKIKDLAQKYLVWCVMHRSPRTKEWYEGHLKSFIGHPGMADINVSDLKPYHIIEWVDNHPTWGNTYKRGAIVAIQRLFNWAEEMGYIPTTPIKKITKPPAQRRETYMVEADYTKILKTLRKGDPFRRILMFIWGTGCRPQEVRHIEPRHVDLVNERIVFPAEESKGKRTKRIIYLQGIPLKIIKRLMLHRRDEGKLFRNYRGKPWSKYAICNRFNRISKKIGKRMFAYAARHGFGTRKLIQGHDHLTVAALMGHVDGSMLAKIYSHIDQDTAHLKRALAD